MNYFEKEGENFKSLQENPDIVSTEGKPIFHIFRTRAEFELNFMKDRTNARLIAARTRGRVGGLPKLTCNFQ